MNGLDKLGKIISEDLRDGALNRYLDLESGWGATTASKELREKISEFSEEQRKVIRTIVTTCIDTGIHDFLFAVKEGREGITVNIDGNNVARESDGLQGEIFTDDGWFEKYSQHRERGI